VGKIADLVSGPPLIHLQTPREIERRLGVVQEQKAVSLDLGLKWKVSLWQGEESVDTQKGILDIFATRLPPELHFWLVCHLGRLEWQEAELVDMRRGSLDICANHLLPWLQSSMVYQQGCLTRLMFQSGWSVLVKEAVPCPVQVRQMKMQAGAKSDKLEAQEGFLLALGLSFGL
jgi:hypothetical protein